MLADEFPKIAAGSLRRDAEDAVSVLPALLARAVRLGVSVAPGVHGRRRTGPGETFWQFRQAVPGDPISTIDWRRSARQRKPLVRETEWEAAQTVWFWLDRSASMSFRSKRSIDSKHHRGALLVLALSVLLVRAGERVGLVGRGGLPAVASELQLERMAEVLCRERETEDEYGIPPDLPENCRGAVIAISDFFGDAEPLQRGLRTFSASGATVRLLQVVDPSEEAFPFSGRVRFESPLGAMQYRAEVAEDLAVGYREKLEKLRSDLRRLARRTDGRFSVHRTNESPRQALVWLAAALGQEI